MWVAQYMLHLLQVISWCPIEELKIKVAELPSSPLVPHMLNINKDALVGVYINTMKTTFLSKFWLLTIFFKLQVYN